MPRGIYSGFSSNGRKLVFQVHTTSKQTRNTRFQFSSTPSQTIEFRTQPASALRKTGTSRAMANPHQYWHSAYANDRLMVIFNGGLGHLFHKNIYREVFLLHWIEKHVNEGILCCMRRLPHMTECHLCCRPFVGDVGCAGRRIVFFVVSFFLSKTTHIHTNWRAAKDRKKPTCSMNGFLFLAEAGKKAEGSFPCLAAQDQFSGASWPFPLLLPPTFSLKSCSPSLAAQMLEVWITSKSFPKGEKKIHCCYQLNSPLLFILPVLFP